MLTETSSIPKPFSLKWIAEIYFSIMLIELVIGGGGHFFEIGPLTLRMVLYFFAVPMSLVYVFFKQEIPQYVFYLLTVFTVLLIVASVIGVLNGAAKELIFEDVKIIAYFYTLLFFSMVIRDYRMIERVCSIIKYSSLFLTVIYLIIIILITAGYINFLEFYNWIYTFDEIAFRGDVGFFIYKGFIYLCIGFIFWMLEETRYSKLIGILILLAIITTLTRGFLISTLGVYVLYYMLVNKNKWVSLWIILAVVIITIVALPLYIETLGDRDESDSIRILQIEQVGARTDVANTFVGNGFGIGVPIRKTHFEIAYLEIFTKQGIVGLMFWFGLLSYIILMYLKVYKNERYFKKATAFFFSVILIYIQSFTNPYLTNPIGLSIVLVTIVIFNRMIKMAKQQYQ